MKGANQVVIFKTGDFMVCFPSDAHKVGMMNTVPGMVKKS